MNLPRYLWLGLLGVATLALVGWAAREGVRSLRVVEARETLRKLGRLTLETYAQQRAPRGNEFWASLGRSQPMLDPWGREFLLQSEKKALYWRSAGPDGIMGNGDDIVQVLPLDAEGRLVMTQPEASVLDTPPSADAR